MTDQPTTHQLADAPDPTPLRWGLNDVMWGDDDSVTVLLSGPGGEPYWLELDPERATVLRQDLAGPPVVQTPIREQLLNALDFSFCQSLGYGTPEGLLAAYEASRTQTVDQAALRDRIAATLRTTRRISYEGKADHGTHRYDARCALCAGDVDALTEALAAAVLPATTSHDTDIRAAALREAADRAEIVALRLRLKHDYGAANGAYEVMEDLRRLAAECPECGTTGACNGGPCPLRLVADETAAAETQAAGAQRLCGKSRGVSGLYYRPCARPAGHEEAYCKSADGSHLFLAGQPDTETQAHVCKPDAIAYYCPTSGETESNCHGGFDACCDQPDLHQPATGARQPVISCSHDPERHGPEAGCIECRCTSTTGHVAERQEGVQK